MSTKFTVQKVFSILCVLILLIGCCSVLLGCSQEKDLSRVVRAKRISSISITWSFEDSQLHTIEDSADISKFFDNGFVGVKLTSDKQVVESQKKKMTASSNDGQVNINITYADGTKALLYVNSGICAYYVVDGASAEHAPEYISALDSNSVDINDLKDLYHSFS